MNQFVIVKENGIVKNMSALDSHLKELPDGYTVANLIHKDKNTDKLRAFYFYQVVPAVKKGLVDLGHENIKSNADAHEFLKENFLPLVSVFKDGQLHHQKGSTTTLNTKEYCQYLERIVMFSAEYLGIYIKFPDEEGNYFNR